MQFTQRSIFYRQRKHSPLVAQGACLSWVNQVRFVDWLRGANGGGGQVHQGPGQDFLGRVSPLVPKEPQQGAVSRRVQPGCFQPFFRLFPHLHLLLSQVKNPLGSFLTLRIYSLRLLNIFHLSFFFPCSGNCGPFCSL